MRTMCHLSVILGAAALLSQASAGAQDVMPNVQVHGPSGDSAEPLQRSLDQIIFTPTKGKTGIASARLAGNPAEPGLYVVMVKMALGAENPPHTHPDGRVTTVFRGKVLFGIGKAIDRTKAKIYEAGAFYYTPPNVPHYLISMAPDTLYQEVGVGPSASNPVATK